MACGVLSYSKVRATTRVADTAEQVERLVRAWRRADQPAETDAEQMRLASRSLSTRVDEDGMVVLRGRLTPEVGAVLLRGRAYGRAAPGRCAGAGGRERVGRQAGPGQPR